MEGGTWLKETHTARPRSVVSKGPETGRVRALPGIWQPMLRDER